MRQYHVGVDLHKYIVQVCVLDAQGEVREERRFHIPDLPSAVPLLEWLAPYMAEGRLAVEALGCNRWFVNACRQRGWDFLVVDAGKLALRREGKKTDRRDAFEIARRPFLGDLHRCARTYYPTDVEYGRRKVLRIEHSQIQKRTETIAQIRGLLNAYKIAVETTQLWTQKSIDWLRTLELPTEDLTFSLQVLVEDLQSVQKRVLALKKRIKQMAESNEEARLWMNILPSTGPQTALMIRAELGDPKRFRNARAVASYAGVVPRVTASADKAHHPPRELPPSLDRRPVGGSAPRERRDREEVGHPAVPTNAQEQDPRGTGASPDHRCVGHVLARRGVLARALPGPGSVGAQAVGRGINGGPTRDPDAESNGGVLRGS